jgi:hypothetical protein
LFVLLFITFLFGVLTVEGLGSAITLDFTFEKDILYSESNPVYDSSFNLRNQTVFTDNYPATYSFESIPIGDYPDGWVNGSGYGTNVQVIQEFNGHDKVLNLSDYTNIGRANIRVDVDSIVSETIEFWLARNNLDTGKSIAVLYMYEDVDNMVYVRWNEDDISSYDGSWHSIALGFTSVNKWDHYKLELDDYNNRFEIYINGVTKGFFNFRTNSTIKYNKIYFQTYNSHQDYEVYVDALGLYSDKTKYTNEWFDLSGEGGDYPLGITWDGDSFWVCDDTIAEVSQYSSAGVYTGEHFDTSSQDIYPMGLTWDGAYFWVVGSNTDEVYQYTSAGVYTTIHFDVGAQDGMPVGITWDGDSFWVAGSITDEVYQYNSTGSYTGVHFDVSSAGDHPSDITWDGEYLWVLGYNDQEVYQYTIEGVYTGVHFDVIDTDIAQEGIVWVDGYFWLTGLGNVKAYEYKYVEFPYTIGDNMIPVIETYEGVYEPDKWDFYYEGEFDRFDNGDDNPNGWLDVETSGDDVNCKPESIVEILVDSGETNGLKKDDFSISELDKLNVSFGFNILAFSPVLTTRIDMLIYSYDSTELVQVYLDEDGDIGYHDGSSYIVLDTGLTVDDVDYRIELYMDYEIDLCFMSYYADSVFIDKFMFPFQTLNKEGLDEIHFLGVADTSGLQIYLDYIGVYNDNNPLTTEFALMGFDVTKESMWYFDTHNLVSIDVLGDEVITYLESNASIGAPGFSPETLISKRNYNGSVIINLYDYEYDSYWGYSYINLGFLSFLFYNQFEVNSLNIEGVKLVEGINEYPLEFSYNNILTNESYFYVDSSNRLQFNLIANDDNLEHIQAIFDIENIATENRSIHFYSNINGNSKGFFALDYESATSSTIEFPYSAKSTNIILAQTEYIKSFTILITDNNLDNDDACEGYITNVRLIYYPDLATTITSLNLLSIIVPLIILIAPPMTLQKKFGSKVILPMFILMAIVCVVSKLIPVWLFFVIAFASIGFIVLKEKIGVEM